MEQQGVSIIRAAGLKKEDLVSLSDPYFLCRVGSSGSSWAQKGFESEGLQFRGETIQDCHDPEWGAKFTFNPSEDIWAFKLASAFSSQENIGAALELGLFELELAIRVYDNDRGRKDDLLGEASIRIPKGGEKKPTALPLTAANCTQGSITVEFYISNMSLLHECTRDQDKYYKAKHTFEEVLESVSNFFRGNEGGTSPSLQYWVSLPKARAAFESGDVSYFWSRSADGGVTCPFLEPGTQAILSHEAVVDELESFCQRWVSGKIYRGNGLAFTRLNSDMWSEMDPAHMSLNMTVEQHALVRPLLEQVLKRPHGNWDEAEILEHASKFIGSFEEDNLPLKVMDDIGVWVCIYLHKVLLGMDLEYTQGLRYYQMQKEIRLVSAMPGKLLELLPSMGNRLKEAQDFRRETLKLFKPFILNQFPQLGDSEEDLHLATSTWMDTILFNIGSATRVTLKAFESMQDNDDISEENLLPFVWEVVRYYSSVPSVHYSSGPDEKHRTVITMSTAMRDPRVWGDNADKFKLRDLEQYTRLSTAFAEQGIDKENPANNRYCPGKELCLAMATGFLQAFLRKRDKFILHGSGPVSEWELTPKEESMGDILERLSKGEAVELTAGQMEDYFKKLSNHPKYDSINLATKFLANLVMKRIVLQKEGEGDKGAKSIDEICLPKPRCNLSFKMVTGVPGLGIVDDDEDWTDKNALEEFVLNSKQGLTFFFAKQLPFNDEPTYFESDEEALAMVKKHFPGDILPSPKEAFTNIGSDETLSHIAFYGMGQVYLQRTPGRDTYQVDLTSLSSMEPREGYEKPGAKAVFSGDGTPLEIFVSSMDMVVEPGQDDWEHAKRVWMNSLLLKTTVGAHLLDTHFTVANCAHIAVRTTLNANHAIRRVLKVFLFNTGQVNLGGYFFLAEKDMLLDRMSGVTYESLTAVFHSSFEEFRFATFPDFLDAKELGEDVKARIPIYTDALLIWRAYHSFFMSYVDFIYKEDEAIIEDGELKDFWECVDLRGNLGSPWRYGLPDLSRESLVNYLTHVAFYVTAWHEHVGTIVHYVLPPAKGMGLKIRPAKEENDVQAVVQNLSLVAFTGMANPLIMSNWKHLLPGQPEVYRLHDQLMDDLQKVVKEVDALNAAAPNTSRPRTCQTFNPKYLETSVSL